MSNWSDIIRRQGEEARARDNEELRIATEQFPEKVAAIPCMENVELLETLRVFAGRYDHRPKQQELIERYTDALNNEALIRMNS
jgi:hypothetical protein